MTREFVPYEEALALKELGFDEPCFGFFQEIVTSEVIKKGEGFGVDLISKDFIFSDAEFKLGYTHRNSLGEIIAPLYQQAFRWFRDKHSLLHEVNSVQKDSWLITIWETSSTTDSGVYNGNRWDCDDLDENIPHTHEEAELVCLKKLIEIVKKK